MPEICYLKYVIRLEELLIDDLKIYQDDEYYTFTSDSVLLSRFATVKKGDAVADYCSGSGIVGFHLYALNKEKIESVTMFEMLPQLAKLSVMTAEYNGLSEKIGTVNVKVQDIPKEYNGKFSLIICNPPYARPNSGEVNKDPLKAVCRTEIELTLAELVSAIDKGLKFGGRVAMVHRADRVCEVISEMQKHKIEPKKMQFVRAKGKEPYLLLIEGVKGGKSGIKVLNEREN